MGRPSAGIYLAFLILVLAAEAGLLLGKSVLLIDQHEGDALHVIQIATQMAHGQVPHEDEDFLDDGTAAHDVVAYDDADERHELAKLELVAGRRAKASTAYDSARRYFVAGLELATREGRIREAETVVAVTVALPMLRGSSGRPKP